MFSPEDQPQPLLWFYHWFYSFISLLQKTQQSTRIHFVPMIYFYTCQGHEQEGDDLGRDIGRGTWHQKHIPKKPVDYYFTHLISKIVVEPSDQPSPCHSLFQALFTPSTGFYFPFWPSRRALIQPFFFSLHPHVLVESPTTALTSVFRATRSHWLQIFVLTLSPSQPTNARPGHGHHTTQGAFTKVQDSVGALGRFKCV